MTPEGLFRFATAFPDPMLLLTRDGVVVAANPAARRILGGGSSLVGRRLVDLVDDGPDKVQQLLQRWMRTPTLTLGAVRWRRPGAPSLACRADGARVPMETPGAAPFILLQCRPKSEEETTGRFLALNERIAALHREIAGRTRIEAELRDQREWFRVTLASIGDAVLATDRDGRLTFMNGAAQQLTGWAADEAIGKPVGDVLRLLSERTREPADDPIARVLDGGRVLGLANHTLLIDRNGREHPIDDSAAPIRGADGTILGVVMVFHDVSDRQSLLREISRSNEELAEADRRKDEFLAMLGHELRNPLSAMMNALAVQRLVPTDQAGQQRAGRVLDRQLAIIGRLVDDLLDVARIRRGTIELRREPFDLRLAAERATETARPLFHSRELTVALHQSAEPLLVDADPIRIEQVVTNLISNAVKYTPRGGTIDVATAVEGADVVITVRDTGIGMDAALLSKIFDLFVQGERSLHRPEGGLGIGLTLARTLVEMHGGRLDAASAGPGHGSTLTIRLPRLVEARSTSTIAVTSTPSDRSIRVLVVDDHPDSAEMLGTLLRSHGHRVEIAHDGPGALAAATSFRPDLVLLDIGLPGMDGYAVARALRENPELATMTIAALTGYGQPQDRARGREAGFDLHLVKPITPEQLQHVVAGIR